MLVVLRMLHIRKQNVAFVGFSFTCLKFKDEFFKKRKMKDGCMIMFEYHALEP